MAPEKHPHGQKYTGQAKWLKAGVIFREEYSETEAGTPQGGIISPCLANLALNGLASKLKKKFMNRKVVNGKEINNKVHTIFYADDFIVTGKSRELSGSLAGDKRIHAGERINPLGGKDTDNPREGWI